jgi:hypothetical protein
MLHIFDIPSIFNLKEYPEIRYLIRKPGKTNILVLVTSAIIIYVVYPYLGLPGTSNAFYYFIFRPMIIILELAIYII